MQPFEAGGEAKLEAYANKSNCSLFVLGSHTKKRPHNLVLGRMYDFHLYDALELGVQRHKAIREFKGAAAAQVGNKVSRHTDTHAAALGTFSPDLLLWAISTTYLQVCSERRVTTYNGPYLMCI